MSLIKVNKNENPYDVIGNYIEKHISVIDNVIAVISINGEIHNELFLIENSFINSFIWEMDWWEGEENVELIDFFFVSDACKKYSNNDFISRQSAIDMIDDLYAGKMPFTVTYDAINSAFKTLIRMLPSARPTFDAKDTQYNLPIDMDLISRQAAFDALNHELRCGAVINQCGLEAAYEVIEDLPSAEPQIIRCKDCKHFEYDHFENVNRIPLIVAHEICIRWGNGDGVKTSENGYCFLAKRREVTT